MTKYESDWAISPAVAGVVEPEKRPERLSPPCESLELMLVGGMYKGAPLEGSTMAMAREAAWVMDVGEVGDVGEAGRRWCLAWCSFWARMEARMTSDS